MLVIFLIALASVLCGFKGFMILMAIILFLVVFE